MGLRIRLNEGYKPVARMMYNAPVANLTPVLAMLVIVLLKPIEFESALERARRHYDTERANGQ